MKNHNILHWRVIVMFEISKSRMPWGFAEFFPLLVLLCVHVADCFDWGSLDLPDDHLPFYFNNNPSVRQLCEEDSACPFKVDKIR